MCIYIYICNYMYNYIIIITIIIVYKLYLIHEEMQFTAIEEATTSAICLINLWGIKTHLAAASLNYSISMNKLAVPHKKVPSSEFSGMILVI